MQSDNDNDGNDPSSYDNSSGDDDEMIHTNLQTSTLDRLLKPTKKIIKPKWNI